MSSIECPSTRLCFVSCDISFRKRDLDQVLTTVNTKTVHYYPTALRRVQITPKTSTNITRYLHRQKSRTFCSRVHWSAENVILQWDKNKMAARTSKTDQGRDKFHTKY